jgi:hypothetical protein
MRQGSRFIPIEIKSSATFTPDFMKGIEWFRKLLTRRSAGGFVLYDGTERFTVRGTEVLNPVAHGLQADLFDL